MATPPLGAWPTFTVHGKLDSSGVNYFMNGSGFQGEPEPWIEDGKLKLLCFNDDAATRGGIAYTEKTLESDLLSGWVNRTSGASGLVDLGPLEGTPGNEHLDTPGQVYNPYTKRWLTYYTEDTGVLPAASTEIGRQFSIGCAEPTAIWLQSLNGGLGGVRLFYRGHTVPEWVNEGSPRAAAGQFGQQIWSIAYADSSPDGWSSFTKRPAPFWNPHDESGRAQQWVPGWRGAWHPGITLDERAEGIHMVVTRQTQLHHFWSDNYGDTWYQNPNNPIVTLGGVGSPPTHPNAPLGEMGAPKIVIDETFNRYILIFDGTDTPIPAGKSSRYPNNFYAASASRPAPATVATRWRAFA